MAVKTATATKTAAPKKAAKKAPAAAKKVATKKVATASGGVDYRTARAQRQAALTDEQRQTYEQAYHDAGRAMDLAELVYAARTEAGLTQTQLAAATRAAPTRRPATILALLQPLQQNLGEFMLSLVELGDLANVEHLLELLVVAQRDV